MDEERFWNLVDIMVSGNVDAASFLATTIWSLVMKMVFWIEFPNYQRFHEDWAQEVTLKLLLVLPGLKTRKSYAAICRRVAHNYAISQIRKERTIERAHYSFARLQELLDADPKAEFERDKSVVLLQRAIAFLSEKERTLFLLRFDSKLKISEIAERLDSTPGAVGIKIRRTYKKVAKIFKKLQDEDENETESGT